MYDLEQTRIGFHVTPCIDAGLIYFILVTVCLVDHMYAFLLTCSISNISLLYGFMEIKNKYKYKLKCFTVCCQSSIVRIATTLQPERSGVRGPGTGKGFFSSKGQTSSGAHPTSY